MKKTIRAIYSAIPFKKQIFTALRLFHPSESVYRHLHFKGIIKIGVDGHSFKMKHYGYQLENELFWKSDGSWRSLSLTLWQRLSERSGVIMDIGSNTGVYSLLAGAVNRSASIYAFEPLVYTLLENNVRLNDFNIQPFKLAISNGEGEATFFTDSTDFSYTASLNKDHQSYANRLSIQVKTTTLDKFCEDNNLVPDLVKIDVERHEPEVIEGFLRSIERSHPAMLIEVLDDHIGQRLRELLKDTGYRYYSIDDVNHSCKRMKELGKPEDFNVLACTPETALYLGLPDLA